VDLCKKKKNSDSQEDIERQYGRKWIWTAIDAPTQLLITFQVDDGRKLDDARKFLENLTSCFILKPLFVSDELVHYGTSRRADANRTWRYHRCSKSFTTSATIQKSSAFVLTVLAANGDVLLTLKTIIHALFVGTKTLIKFNHDSPPLC